MGLAVKTIRKLKLVIWLKGWVDSGKEDEEQGDIAVVINGGESVCSGGVLVGVEKCWWWCCYRRWVLGNKSNCRLGDVGSNSVNGGGTDWEGTWPPVTSHKMNGWTEIASIDAEKSGWQWWLNCGIEVKVVVMLLSFRCSQLAVIEVGIVVQLKASGVVVAVSKRRRWWYDCWWCHGLRKCGVAVANETRM